MAPNAAYRRLGPLVVIVAGTNSPSDAEWSGYLDLYMQMEREYGHFSAVSTLVFSDSSAPNGQQMVALGKVLKGQAAPTAVVSDSVLLRVANAVMSLINPRLRVFSPRDWQRAFDFLQVSTQQTPEVLATVHALGRELGALKVLRALPRGEREVSAK